MLIIKTLWKIIKIPFVLLAFLATSALASKPHTSNLARTGSNGNSFHSSELDDTLWDDSHFAKNDSHDHDDDDN